MTFPCLILLNMVSNAENNEMLILLYFKVCFAMKINVLWRTGQTSRVLRNV